MVLAAVAWLGWVQRGGSGGVVRRIPVSYGQPGLLGFSWWPLWSLPPRAAAWRGKRPADMLAPLCLSISSHYHETPMPGPYKARGLSWLRPKVKNLNLVVTFLLVESIGSCPGIGQEHPGACPLVCLHLCFSHGTGIRSQGLHLEELPDLDPPTAPPASLLAGLMASHSGHQTPV